MLPVLILGLLLGVEVFAGPRLWLVGGGKRPEAGLSEFARWAGGSQARVLVIGWSSQQPEVYFESLSRELGLQGVLQFEAALSPPVSSVARAEFLAQLDRATAVFFTGGDQNRTMAVLNADQGLREAIRGRFLKGLPVGGTSAGTAIMSDPMLIGSGSQLAPGLGLLPSGILVDQHFILRGREPRLVDALLNNGMRHGIGIDEDSSVLITEDSDLEGHRVARVIGPTDVVFIEVSAQQGQESRIRRERLTSGLRFDLSSWRALGP